MGVAKSGLNIYGGLDGRGEDPASLRNYAATRKNLPADYADNTDMSFLVPVPNGTKISPFRMTLDQCFQGFNAIGATIVNLFLSVCGVYVAA